MTKDPFEQLHHNQNAGEQPKIVNQALMTMYFKRKIHNKILYTRIHDGEMTSFEGEENQWLHKNQDFELMYVLHGSLTNVIEEKEFHYQAGEGCLLNTQIAHAETLDENCDVLFLNISRELMLELLPTVAEDGPIFQFFRENLKAENLWKRNYLEFTQSLPYPNLVFINLLDFLQQELATPKIGSVYFQRGLLLRLLSALENPNSFALWQNNLDSSREEHLVSRIIQQIETSFGNISRQQIQNSMNYNAEYLNRLLKKQTGKTITAYAQEIRVAKAKQALSDTSHTIQSIAESLGFANESYFYHYFKKQTGLSPKQYRLKFKKI